MTRGLRRWGVRRKEEPGKKEKWREDTRMEVENRGKGLNKREKADSNEDMTPMPKNKFKVLDIDPD
ncbi:hypothetical protein DPMN_033564 [Dreissena polymorpha]|uniref:Uncharacterized protein n=1 Tax=Dreissena polymorpha TaxID=45954 RepID=A0A9D4M618_DREPO|nr:hypothetical protein DPMN_033564 [Dreissena polymorpha]